MNAPRRGSGLLGAAALIAGVTVLARLLGFGRWLAQASGVGAGAIGDAYNSANLLPNVLFEIAAGGALAGAVVPILAGLVQRGAREDVDRVVGAALGWTLLVLVPLGGLLAGFAGPLAAVLPGAEGLEALVRFFLVVFAVQVPLYGTAVLLYGVLQAHHRFFWPAFAPALASVVTIAAYLVYGRLAGGELDDPSALGAGALDWLAWGTTAGVAAMVLPLIGPVRSAGVRLRPSLRFPPGVGRRMLALAASGVGGLLAQQGAYLAVMLVANARGGDGTFTVYSWTQAVYLLPYAVLVVPLATSTYPRLAAHAAHGDRSAFARLTSATTRAVLVAGGAGTAGLVAVAPAVMVVFLQISGTDLDVPVVTGMSGALVRMALGVLGYGLVFHASRTLFALERGRAAVTGVTAGWVTVVVAALVLTSPQPDQDVNASGASITTLGGLGSAVSVGMVVGAAALLLLVRRAAGPGSLAGLVRTAVVLGVGAGAGSVAGHLTTLLTAGLPMPWVPVTADASLDRFLEVGVLRALVAAAAGGLVALVLTGGAVMLGDRATVRGLRAAQAEPAVTAPGPGDPV